MAIVIPQSLLHIMSQEEYGALRDTFKTISDSYQQYKDMLELHPDDLSGELIKQAQHYAEITRVASIASSIHESFATALDAIKALAEMHTREAYEDDEKMMLPYTINKLNTPKLSKATEGVIKSAVESYDIVVELNKILISTHKVYQTFQGLERSWNQRSINLNKLADFELKEMQFPNAKVDKIIDSMHDQRMNEPR